MSTSQAEPGSRLASSRMARSNESPMMLSSARPSAERQTRTECHGITISRRVALSLMRRGSNRNWRMIKS